MTTILRIDSSARQGRSLTRSLCDDFLERWLASEPRATVIRRDVGHRPPPYVDEAWIAAAFAKGPRSEEQAVALRASDELIDEIVRSDVIVIGAPMYNYGMPAALKAWFDQVIRIHRTFSFDLARGDQPIEPILSGKTVVLLTSAGEFGFEPGQPNAGSGHLVPHLRTVSRYLGAGDRIHHVGIEYQEFGDERHRRSIRAAQAEVAALVDRLQGQSDCISTNELKVGGRNHR